jgi:hypothetical protein
LVDEPLAGGECLAPVRSDDLDPQRRLVHRHHPDAVDETYGFHGPAFLDLVEQEMELVFGHAKECLVFNGPDGLSLFVAAHDPEKADDRAHIARQLASRRQ